MTHKLSRFVSGRIARTNPLEGGPVYEAMMRGGGLIQDTWGGYLSRLIEHYQGKLSPEDAKQLLGVDSEMLHDKNLQFRGMFDYSDYQEELRLMYGSEARERFGAESLRLLTIFNAICETFVVPDDQDRDVELAHLYDLVDENECEYESGNSTEDEWDAYFIRNAGLQSRIEAVESGICVSARELASIMIGATPVQDETLSELWRTWIRSIRYVLEDAPHNHSGSGDALAKDIYLGLDDISWIRRTLLEAKVETDEYIKERIEFIKPAFFASSIENHPLVTGVQD